MPQAIPWSKITLVVIVLLSSSLHFIRHLAASQLHDYPAGLDPYYFAAASEAVASQLPGRPLDSFMIDSTGNQYPPLLYWTIGLISRLTTVEVTDLYLWLGPFLGALLIPIAYLTFRRILSPWPSIFAATAYAFSPFVFTRTFLTLPENVAVLWFLIILWLYLGRFSWLKLAAGLGLWLLMFLTHLTAFYVPITIGLWLGQLRILKRYWPWYLVGGGAVAMALATPPFRSSLSTLWQLSKTSVIGWSPPTLQYIDQYLSTGLACLGGAGFIMAIFSWRDPTAKKLLTLSLPFAFLTFFYKTQLKDFGPIWPERFLLYTAVSTSLLAAWFLEKIIIAYNPKRLVLTMGIALTISVSTLQPAFYWFWPFSDEEVKAARWLKDHTPPTSVVVAQPLVNWLIRAQANRFVLWIDSEKTPPTIALSTTQAMKDRWGNWSSRPFYIFTSKPKLSQEYPAEFLNGQTKPVGYPPSFLPYYDEKVFSSLPTVYQSPTVTIYQLIP